MKELFDFIAKARYPVIFLMLGLILALVAAAQTIKILGVELAPYGAPAHIGLAALGAIMFALGIYMVFTGEARGPARKIKYDVFLAAPMAGTATEAEYQETRDLCLDVLTLMRTHCGVTTYYFVGEKLESPAQFESFDVAAEKDFDAIAASRNFVLIYPRRVVSSVLAEAGFALARGIDTTLFVADEADLPYLLKKAGELPHGRYPRVHIRPYGTPLKLKQMIRNDGPALFHPPAPAAED